MNILLASLVLLGSGDSPEWSGFRGNNGSGVAAASSVPDSLDLESNLAWRVELPAGYSSPVISGDLVFATGSAGEHLFTLCLDRATGEELWRRSVPFDGVAPGANSAAAPSPVTNGAVLVTMFHSVGMLAYDMQGQELWRVPMGPFSIPHGLATSPLIHGNSVFQCIDQDDESFLVALDLSNGEELWRTARPEATHGYATPALWTPDGADAQIVVAGSLEVAGYNARSGNRVWWAKVGCWQAKSMPIISGDTAWVNSFMVGTSEFRLPNPEGSFESALADKDSNGNGRIDREEWDHSQLQRFWFIFDLNDDDSFDQADWTYFQAASRRFGGLYSIQLGGTGDVTETHVNWSYDKRRGMSDVVTPVLMDGILYTVKEGGIMTSLNAETGEVLEQERVGDSDKYFASPVGGNNRIVLAGLSGQLSVVEAGSDWEAISTTTLDEAVWSTPALAGSQVFVRSVEALYCFDSKAKMAEMPSEEADK